MLDASERPSLPPPARGIDRLELAVVGRLEMFLDQQDWLISTPGSTNCRQIIVY